ncbi:MAG: hypothetical protein J6W30_06555 [Bacteroidales bacterium]|nr:hypothetical protein [Bacteroidales bacterium]
MIRVANAISALFYDHHVVIVPGLGAFLCQAEGAKVNVITNQFEKPTATLSFDPQRREDNDLIVDHLIALEGMDEAAARQLVVEFVTDCFAKLKAGETVNIPEVGELSLNGDQELVFSPVESNNFNGDAFGLEDLQPTPIHTGNQSNWKEQVSQQIKDLNTPMTVDIKHDDDHHGKWWIWLLLLLLIAGGVALWYFYFRSVEPEPEPKPIVPTVVVEKDTLETTRDTIEVLNDTLEISMDTVEAPLVDTVEEPLPPVEVVVPPADKKVFIIGGCFSVELNAAKMADEEKEKGFADVFVMKRGSMFYVCYGQYATTQEAKADLPRVWQTCPKAWILNK